MIQDHENQRFAEIISNSYGKSRKTRKLYESGRVAPAPVEDIIHFSESGLANESESDPREGSMTRLAKKFGAVALVAGAGIVMQDMGLPQATIASMTEVVYSVEQWTQLFKGV